MILVIAHFSSAIRLGVRRDEQFSSMGPGAGGPSWMGGVTKFAPASRVWAGTRPMQMPGTCAAVRRWPRQVRLVHSDTAAKQAFKASLEALAAERGATTWRW